MNPCKALRVDKVSTYSALRLVRLPADSPLCRCSVFPFNFSICRIVLYSHVLFANCTFLNANMTLSV